MGDVDRAARERATRAAQDRARQVEQERVTAERSRSSLLAEGRLLARRAAVLLAQHDAQDAVSFRVRRTRRGGFARSRAGWYVGSVRGSLGYGQTGKIPIHLLSTGELVWASEPSVTEAVTPVPLEFFLGRFSPEGRLAEVVTMLRAVVARHPE